MFNQSFTRLIAPWVVLISLALLLPGCSTKKKSTSDADAAPKKIPCNLDKVPNAVPKHEPLSKCGNKYKKGTYVIRKKRHKVMSTSRHYRACGVASWYGTKFHNRKTSSGEPYNMFAMTAAHRTLPLPTYVKVKNLENGKCVVVKVNDRGPFHGNRIIDLSYVAAHKLGMLPNGIARVEVISVDPRDHGRGYKKQLRLAEAEEEPKREPKRFLPSSKFYLHVGSYVQREKAQDVLNKVSKLPKSSASVSESWKGKSKRFLVKIGPFHSQQDALKYSPLLTRLQLPTPVVIKE